MSMQVIKRNNNIENVSFDKIFNRINKLIKSNKLSEKVNGYMVCQKTIELMTDKMKTETLDILSADICANMMVSHSDYSYLGARILLSNLKKNLEVIYGVKLFSEITNLIVKNVPNYLNENYISFVNLYSEQLNEMINNDYDYLLDYFAFKTLERAYLIKNQKTKHTYETPQMLWLRVSIAIHIPRVDVKSVSLEETFEQIKRTYNLMGQGKFIHATPTLFNAGTNHEQCSSCFLMGTEDSVEGIFKTFTDVALISKWAGGIGIHISNVRGKGQHIKTTNGESTGIVPMLQVLNNIGRFITQSGKRNGSIAIYLEPHHMDILDFLELRKNGGSECDKCRDLFLALWISDLFMHCVEHGKPWYLMSENECPGLTDAYGDDYKKLYYEYVDLGKYTKKVDAKMVWQKIISSQMETGTPYILYKDNINKKSNQKNLGTIKSSNLCVHEDTLILTKIGNQKIRSLKDKEVEIWNGEEWSKVVIRQTGRNQNLIRVNFSNESFLDCTSEHKFYIENENDNKIIEKKAYELQIDDKIIKFKLPSSNDIQKISVKSVSSSYENVDTYCFTEHKRHMGIFNGVLTGQCAEIVEYSDEKEYAVCNLASIALSKFYDQSTRTYDYEGLHEVAKQATYNLNRIIDLNYYPTKETKYSNLKNRPMGIGIQGFADLLAMMHLPYESIEAIRLSGELMECIYHGSLEMSNELAKNYGPYDSYQGSPISEGILQLDMWSSTKLSGRWDWMSLRQKISENGVRNSLLTALMPTASTSQILGNNECFEPFTSNLYSRLTLAGNFIIFNKHLQRDLDELGLWNEEMKNKLMSSYGSIQGIEGIPKNIKDVYKTVWEIKQKAIIDHAISRSPFVDQSQSMNLFFEKPDATKLTSALMYGWKNGLKTGMYYLRSQSSANAQQFTIEPVKTIKKEEAVCESCSA